MQDDGGGLVGVAHANNRVEAEMIQGLLEGAGIPSMLQQVGVDGALLGYGLLNPGGGAQRVLVRAGQSEEARALLAEALAGSEATEWGEAPDAAIYMEERVGRGPRNYGVIGAYARIWVVSIGVMALAFAVFMLLRQV